MTVAGGDVEGAGSRKPESLCCAMIGGGAGGRLVDLEVDGGVESIESRAPSEP